MKKRSHSSVRPTVRSARAYAIASLILCTAGVAYAQESIELSSREARELAIARSQAVIQASLGLDLQVERFRLGIRSFLPSASFSLSNSDSVTRSAQDTRVTSIGLTIEQLVFNGGRLRRQRELARSDLNLAHLQLSNSIEQVGDQAWNAFFDLALAEEQVAIQSESLSLAEERLVISERELELGLITPIDALEVELQVSDIRLAVQEARGRREIALFALKRALSVDPRSSVTIRDELDLAYEGVSLMSREGALLDLASLGNLGIQEARAQRSQANLRLAVAANWWQPRITADVTIGASGARLPLQRMTFEAGIDIEFIAPEAPTTGSGSLSFPSERTQTRTSAFSSGILPSIETSLSVREARLASRSASVTERETIDQVLFTVSESLQTHDQQRSRVTILRERERLQERRIEVMLQQIDLGQRTRSDLLGMQIEQNETRFRIAAEIVTLLQLERTIEQLAGLATGDLATLVVGSEDE